jgi:hypothetical protein
VAERRRFPAPWTVEKTQQTFIVRGHNGKPFAFVYREDEPGRRTTGKLLRRDVSREFCQAAGAAKVVALI